MQLFVPANPVRASAPPGRTGTGSKPTSNNRRRWSNLTLQSSASNFAESLLFARMTAPRTEALEAAFLRAIGVSLAGIP